MIFLALEEQGIIDFTITRKKTRVKELFYKIVDEFGFEIYRCEVAEDKEAVVGWKVRD